MNKKGISVLLTMALAMATPLYAMAEAIPANGVYEGSANGMGGALKVAVTVEDGKISGVEVLEHKETAGISDPAIEQIPQAIVEAQSTDVEAVTGATVTSEAIKEAVAAALSGEGTEEAGELEITIEPDVIVVGAGMAGLSASVRAAELGANVLVLEQNYRVGGSANTAGGSISGAGYKIQKAAGIEDSPELFYQDFVTLGGEEFMNTEIAKVHAERSGAAIDWLQEDVGVEFSDKVDSGSYLTMDINRVTYTAGGASSGGGSYFVKGLSDKLQSYIDAGTVQLCLDTLVTDIVLNDNGDVTGVMVGDKEISAPSTIIATGGYGYCERWLKEFNFTNITSNDPNTAIGSGYDFARKAGAAFDNMNYSSCYGGSVPVTGFQASLRCNINYNGSVWINTNGDRVFNEPKATSMDKRTVWRTSDQNIFYVVFAENMMSEDQPLFTGTMGNSAPFTTEEKIAELIERAMCSRRTPSLSWLRRLAPQIWKRLSPSMMRTLPKGEDSVFGRTDNLLSFEEGPYYAVYTVPYLMMTAGGPARINGQGQLMREDELRSATSIWRARSSVLRISRVTTPSAASVTASARPGAASPLKARFRTGK